MILALDVHYREGFAKAVGVLFNWESSEPTEIIIEIIAEVENYIPGSFYKRELPCLLKIISKIDLNNIETIIVDGYVFTDNLYKDGLGSHLYKVLTTKIPIIGVAKTYFMGNKNTVVEIYRGKSKNPLFISSIGIPINEAAEKIQKMLGNYRIPEILKTLDRITKE